MCNVMDAVGLQWVFAGGAILEVVGLIILVKGLDDVRQAFDPEYPGVWALVWAWFLRTGRRLLDSARKLAGLPQRAVHHSESVGIAVESEVAGRGRKTTTPRWEELTVEEQIREVHRLLYGEVHHLHDRVDDEAETRTKAMEGERKMWQAGDRSIRSEVANLTIGGLGTEAWAVVLIISGMLVTFAATVCSIG